MIPMRAFRTDLHFADLFAHVSVFCWPKLWWQINALLARSIRQGVVGLFCWVNDRGFTTLRHAGQAPHPAANKPLARAFRRLTDASCGSDVPVILSDLAAMETLGPVPILLCVSGGAGLRQGRELERLCPQSWIQPMLSAAHTVFLVDERIQMKTDQ